MKSRFTVLEKDKEWATQSMFGPDDTEVTPIEHGTPDEIFEEFEEVFKFLVRKWDERRKKRRRRRAP